MGRGGWGYVFIYFLCGLVFGSVGGTGVLWRDAFSRLRRGFDLCFCGMVERLACRVALPWCPPEQPGVAGGDCHESVAGSLNYGGVLAAVVTWL